MAISEALRLFITADTGGAVRDIQKVGVATERSLGRSQKSLDKWGRGLSTVGAGMVAFGAVSLVGLGKAAMASEDANLAVVKLENTLSNMPLLAGENSKAFIDLAEATQNKTAADADAIVEAEAMLGTFNLTGQEIRKITPLVVDYARKFGVDMVSAAVQVGKALDGNVGALKRNGVSIDEVAFKTDRFGAVQKALADQVGGFAEAEGKTFAGSLQRLKNQLGDVAEGVGAGAVDAFSDLFSVVEFGADKLNDLSPATQNVIGKVATFGSVALIAGGGLSFTIGQVIKMRQNFAALGAGLSGLSGKLGGLKGALGPVGIGGALFVASVGLAEFLKAQREADIAEAAADFARLRDVTKENAAATLDLNKAVKVSTIDFTASASAADEFRETGEITSDVMRDLDQHWDQLIKKNPELAEGFIRNADELGVGKDKLGEWREELDANVKAEADATEASQAHADAVAIEAGLTTEAQLALQEYNDTLTAMLDPLFGATDALMDNQAASVAVQEAEAAVAVAIRDHGAASAEAKAAQEKLTEAQLKSGKSAADLNQAMATLRAGVEDGTTSVADARDMLVGWVRQGLISESTADALGDQFDATADQADALGRTDPNVRVTETGNRPTQTQLRRTRNEAFGIPTRRHTNVTASDRASNVIRRIMNNIAGLHDKTVHVNVAVSGAAQLSLIQNKLLGFHSGGIVPGPRGQEVAAILQAGERVISLPEMDAMGRGMSGAGGVGGATYVDNRRITINTGADPQSVVAALRRAGEIGLPITIRGRTL